MLPLMQQINYFKWLTEVLQCLGGTPLQVVTTECLQFKKMTISFEVPLKQDLGTMMPIVASGKESLVQMTYERTAIKVCLLELESYGYLIPYLSWFKIKALQQNHQDIVSLCETLSRENLYDIVSEFCYFQKYDSFFDCTKQLIIFAFHLHCRIYLVTLLRQ